MLDEPLSNLGLMLKRELLAMFCDMFAEQQTTLLYVTHDAREAAFLGGRVAIMEHGGKIAANGSLEALRGSTSPRFAACSRVCPGREFRLSRRLGSLPCKHGMRLRGGEAPLAGVNWGGMALVVLVGRVADQMLLMLGLTTKPASSAALLLDLEGLATMGTKGNSCHVPLAARTRRQGLCPRRRQHVNRHAMLTRFWGQYLVPISNHTA